MFPSELDDITTHSNEFEKPLEGNELSLSFTWTSPRSLLEKPLTLGASPNMGNNYSLKSIPSVGSGLAELSAVIIPGDSKLPCFKMYEELETLKGFAAGLYGQGIFLLVISYS